jgi:hypothetical protein
MDNGEYMENARYVMNDDTAGFINQKKHRNTSIRFFFEAKCNKRHDLSTDYLSLCLHHGDLKKKSFKKLFQNYYYKLHIVLLFLIK